MLNEIRTGPGCVWLPRVILIGGSNLAFGIDSQLLAQKLGAPVVNYGLEGGLGLTILLNSLQDNMRPGDIVVISPEYELFYNNLVDGEAVTLAQLLEVDPEFLRYFPIRDWLDIGPIYVTLAQIKVMRQLMIMTETADTKTVYKRSCFDPKSGDEVCQLGLPNLPDKLIYSGPFILKDTSADSIAIDAINHFSAIAREKGAVVLYDYPPE